MSRSAIRRIDLDPPRRGALHFFRLLLPVILIVRLVYAAKLLLVPDEAFYWVWSRHLALGYFDHPPMIAYVIWLGTRILGSNEVGVRLFSVLASVGAMGLIVLLAVRVLHDLRAAAWVAMIWATSPLLAALGILATPDTPVMFFSLCGLFCAATIAERDDRPDASSSNASDASDARLWLLFGIFSGLAMLSKYTGVLLPASVALAMLFSAKGRRHYRRPWIYLSGILALAVFSPVIAWNATHGWASFLFQLHHGTAPGQGAKQFSGLAAVARFFKDLGVYLGDQFFVWTPVLFVIGMVVLVEFWARYLRPALGGRRAREQGKVGRYFAGRPALSQLDQVLLWTATVPLALFGIAAVRSHHTEPNWPGFAYFPLSLLTVRWLMEKWSGQRVRWTGVGIQVALIGLIGMHVVAAPPVTRALLNAPFHVTHQFQDLLGWREYGRWLGRLSEGTGAPVVTNRHQDAGEASFYMPGQPEVWCDSIGTRPTAYEYFDQRWDFAKMPEVIWVGGNHDLFAGKYGYAEVQRFSATIIIASPRAGSAGANSTGLAPPLPGRNSREYAAFLMVRPQR